MSVNGFAETSVHWLVYVLEKPTVRLMAQLLGTGLLGAVTKILGD